MVLPLCVAKPTRSCVVYSIVIELVLWFRFRLRNSVLVMSDKSGETTCMLHVFEYNNLYIKT